MDVVALVPSRDHPSTRYRLLSYADDFARRGMHLTVEPIARHWRDRLRQITLPRRNQIVLVQRRLLPVWQTFLLRRSAGRLIYDFDDAVFLHDSNHPDGLPSWTRRIRFQAMIHCADLVIAGNRFLADHAARWTSPAKIEVIPTCVNPHAYEPAEHKDRQPTRMVWIGTASALGLFKQAEPILEGIGRALPHARLRVVCDQFPRLQHLPVEQSVWSARKEREELRCSDIGLSFMPDDDWSRGKCGLKVLQYLAAGLPVVANPVGIHRDLVGEAHGFLPRTPKAWLDSVRRLSADPDLRRTMGQRGRAWLGEKFSTERWGPVLADRMLDLGGAL